MIEFKSDPDSQNPFMSSTRRTPGKFNEADAVNKFDDRKDTNNTSINNFLYYPTNIDTNAIWKTNDIQRSVSMPSGSNDSSSDGQDILSSIWNAREFPIDISPVPASVLSNYDSSDHCNHNQNHRVNNINGNGHHEDENTRIVNDDENRKIVSIVNSHDGWGVKPINQKIPWEIPEVSVHNNSDGYPDTFSSWLNDNVGQSPTGAGAWETYDSNNTRQNVNNNLISNTNFINSPNVSSQLMNSNKNWSMMSNDTSGWSQVSSVLHGQNCISKPIMNGFKMTDHTSSELPLTTNNYNPPNRMVMNRMASEQMKKSMWMNENRSLNEFQYGSMSNGDNATGIIVQRSRKLEIEIQRYKLYKETHRKLSDECLMEQQQLLELEHNITTISLSHQSLNSRNILSEMYQRRDAIGQNITTLRYQLENLNHKIVPLEDELMRENIISNHYNPNNNNAHSNSMHGHHPNHNNHQHQQQTSQNSMYNMDIISSKMGFMRVNSAGCNGANSPDFRLDVPEFVPGKKWSGTGQNGKENRIPIQTPPISLNSPMPNHFPMSESNNKLYSSSAAPSMSSLSSYYWLLIKELPSHVSIDMVQSFFNQHNTPFVTPMHCNPFARWMMIKFHTPTNCQKAYRLLLGKIGRVSLISDQEANMRLQELKGVMANFVAHQN